MALITTAELADHLHCSADTVYQMAREAEISAIRVRRVSMPPQRATRRARQPQAARSGGLWYRNQCSNTWQRRSRISERSLCKTIANEVVTRARVRDRSRCPFSETIANNSLAVPAHG